MEEIRQDKAKQTKFIIEFQEDINNKLTNISSTIKNAEKID